jgi:chromate transporter
VAALIGTALVRLSRSFVTDVPLALIALAGFALTLLVSAGFLLVLLGAGLAYELWVNASRWARRAYSATLGLPVLLAAAAGAITLSLAGEILWEGLKTGLLSFGGAYTAIPYLQDVAVDSKHWLTESQFVDGLAMGGVLPAPLIIFSTFVGYMAGDLAGGVTMTIGVFLPAFILPIFFHRRLVALADNRRARPFLLGVAAGVIGLIAAVGVEIIETSVVDVPTGMLAVAAFLALNRWHGKLTVLYVVLGAGAIGALLQATGVS